MMNPGQAEQENSCFSIYQKEQSKFEIRYNTTYLSLPNTTRQENKIKDTQIWKEEIKLFVCK